MQLVHRLPNQCLDSQGRVWNTSDYAKTDEFAAICKAAENACAICREITKLIPEHDHITGVVRGPTCRSCNSMIGFGKDNPDRLAAGQRYLIIWKERAATGVDL
jgi:hypothetical protein